MGPSLIPSQPQRLSDVQTVSLLLSRRAPVGPLLYTTSHSQTAPTATQQQHYPQAPAAFVSQQPAQQRYNFEQPAQQQYNPPQSGQQQHTLQQNSSTERSGGAVIPKEELNETSKEELDKTSKEKIIETSDKDESVQT